MLLGLVSEPIKALSNTHHSLIGQLNNTRNHRRLPHRKAQPHHAHTTERDEAFHPHRAPRQTPQKAHRQRLAIHSRCTTRARLHHRRAALRAGEQQQNRVLHRQKRNPPRREDYRRQTSPSRSEHRLRQRQVLHPRRCRTDERQNRDSAHPRRQPHQQRIRRN